MQSNRIDFFTTIEPNNRYKYDFKNDRYEHYILTKRAISYHELEQLKEILASFPATSAKNWPEKFKAFNIQEWQDKLRSFKIPGFATDLLKVATEARDVCGNSVLSIACEYGKDESLIQKLIDLGADLIPNPKKEQDSPFYWAMQNRLSSKDKKSEKAAAAVKCLIENGIDLNVMIVSGKKVSPLDYAKSNGFLAAANLIENALYCKTFRKK